MAKSQSRIRKLYNRVRSAKRYAVGNHSEFKKLNKPWRPDKKSRKQLGLVGFGAAAAHIGSTIHYFKRMRARVGAGEMAQLTHSIRAASSPPSASAALKKSYKTAIRNEVWKPAVKSSLGYIGRSALLGAAASYGIRAVYKAQQRRAARRRR